MLGFFIFVFSAGWFCCCVLVFSKYRCERVLDLVVFKIVGEGVIELLKEGFRGFVFYNLVDWDVCENFFDLVDIFENFRN